MKLDPASAKGKWQGATPELLATGAFSDEASDEEMKESDEKGAKRADEIRDAMRFVWNGYRKHAWGADELKPKSG